MFNKRLAVTGFLGGIGLGIAVLASPSATKGAQDFMEGLLGIPAKSTESANEIVELRAELASPTLNRDLKVEEMEDLFHGFAHYLNSRYAQAVPIIGRYAMQGDGRAQNAIGGMYYFGHGLPVDHDEAIRWLRLAAQQGGMSERQDLAAALAGTWQWDQSNTESEMAYGAGVPQASPNAPAQPRSYDTPGAAYGVGGTVSDSAPMSARASVEQAYGSGSASRRYSDASVPTPQIGVASPVTLNRAGPGTYSDTNGDFYTQAGPKGVINTRTGEFIPTN